MLVTFLYILYQLRIMTFEPKAGSSSGDIDGARDSSSTSSNRNPISSGLNSKSATGVLLGRSVPSAMGVWTSSTENKEGDEELINLSADVYDIIKNIRDPEKPNTLEELEVVQEEGIHLPRLDHMDDAYTVHIVFKPTVPHCSLATLIGLCIRVKLERNLPYKHKVNISIQKGTHSTEDSINKQINDKERIAAAMENPNLKELVDKCIEEDDY